MPSEDGSAALRQLDQAFDEAFEELSDCRVAYEENPRDPERIAALGEARAKLEDARKAMRAERTRLGLEYRVTPEVDDMLARFDGEGMHRWQGIVGSDG